jgi:phage N-6-adenine-methyltransferase
VSSSRGLEAFSLPATDLATVADAEQALKVIAVAEAAEKIWTRAKDATKLYEAIKAKLYNQAAYAVWRQSVAVPSQTSGGDGSNQHSRKARVAVLKSELPPTDPGAVVVHRWRERLCAKVAKNRWRIDNAKLGAVLEDVHIRCVRVCEQQNMGTVRGTEGTGEFERYTPAFYIEKAREVLDEIDLDPATSEQAQKTVRAAEYFTAEDDGLSRDWHGRVWLNPPYHRELAPLFIAKLAAELSAGRVNQAIVLTNNSTDTEWFQLAAALCEVICFTQGRIHFEVPNGAPVLPTQGQAFFYFGANARRFVQTFKAIGLCVAPIS